MRARGGKRIDLVGGCRRTELDDETLRCQVVRTNVLGDLAERGEVPARVPAIVSAARRHPFADRHVLRPPTAIRPLDRGKHAAAAQPCGLAAQMVGDRTLDGSLFFIGDGRAEQPEQATLAITALLRRVIRAHDRAFARR